MLTHLDKQQLLESCHSLLREGQQIEALQAYRTATGCTVECAKAALGITTGHLPSNLQAALTLIPLQPQRQDSLAEQIRDLCVFASHLGMYDAADHLRGIVERSGLGSDQPKSAGFSIHQ